MNYENVTQALAVKFGNNTVSTRDVVTYISTLNVPPYKYITQIRDDYSVAHGKLCFNKSTASAQAVAAVVGETDEDIEHRINVRFNALDVMARATARGINRAMIVSGPAGLGKSHGVETAANDVAGDFEHVKGYIRPTGLFRTLYNNRNKGNLVVFDDADSLFENEISMNLLKGACDSSDVRTLSWLSNSVMEDEDGESIPSTFVFEGSIIFITNKCFQSEIDRGSRMAPHFEALISRSHYLDLGIKNKQDYIVRIKQVLGKGMLDNVLDTEQQDEIVEFMETNIEKMRELSLRMVKKLADLMVMDNAAWKELASITCMKQ